MPCVREKSESKSSVTRAPGLGRRHLAGRQNAPYQHTVEAVFTLLEGLIVFLGAQRKYWQVAIFAEVLCSDLDGKIAHQVLAICGLVALTLLVPGENADLVEIVRQTALGLAQGHQILRNQLAAL